MKVLRLLNDYTEEVICAVLLIYISFMTVFQVITRYFFGYALFWSEETIRYSFIWLVFIGISLGAKQRAHVRILAVFTLLSEKGKIRITLLANLLFIIFCLMIVYLGIEQVASFTQFPQRSSTLRIPMKYVYAACPVGMALTAMRLLQDSVRLYKTKEL